MLELSDLTVEILGERFDLSFHGAIAPLYQGDSYEQALSRVEKVFIGAVEHRMDMKLAWIEDEERNELRRLEGQARELAVRNYGIAREFFKVL